MKHTPTIQAMYHAFSEGDIPSLLQRLHPNVEWTANVDSGLTAAQAVPCYQTGYGREFAANYLQQFAQSYDMHSFDVLAFLEGENEVAVRLRADMTVRKTGRRVTSEIIHHYTLDDRGLVTRFMDFEDTLGFAHAWS